MPSIQLKSDINIDLNEVLKAVTQLEIPDLENFVKQASTVLAQKKATSIPKIEADLLIKINEGIPFEIQHRYDMLHNKMTDSVISTAEHQELLNLAEQIEAKNAKTMEYLYELSQIRKVSLLTLIEQLKLNPPAYA